MKRWTALLLCLLLSLPGLSPAEEAGKVIYASPGDIIEVELALTADSDRPDLLVGQLSYHPDALEPQLSRALTAQGTVYMYNGVPVTIRFRVREFVPEGEYVVSCEVLEAAKREGKAESGVAIAPVKVVVGAAESAKPPEPQAQESNAGHDTGIYRDGIYEGTGTGMGGRRMSRSPSPAAGSRMSRSSASLRPKASVSPRCPPMFRRH